MRFHSRYGLRSSGKTATHSLAAARWRRSRERIGKEPFFPPPKALQQYQRYMTAGEMAKYARYDCLQSCMLHQPLTSCQPLSPWVFLKNILPVIQMRVYIHRIVVDGNFWDDLPINRTWFPVCSHTQLCYFLVH